MSASARASRPSLRDETGPATSSPPAAWRRGTPSELQFDQLISPHIPAMLRASRSILGSDDLAWDAVQETLVRIWDRGWLPQDPAAVLHHLVVRSSLHLLRCRRRRTHHESTCDGSAEGSHSPCCPEDPIQHLESAEQADLLHEALGKVTREYRVVVEMFELQGMSYESISERLRIPIGTVRSRLSRGRALLRERLIARMGAA